MTTTTYCTDAQIKQTSVLAYPALTAYSAARVAAGDSAVTDFDALRVEATRVLLIGLRTLGIYSDTEISRGSDLQDVEAALALALLYEAVQQDPSTDMFGKEAVFWRKRYEGLLARCAPIDNVKAQGAQFSWGRG